MPSFSVYFPISVCKIIDVKLLNSFACIQVTGVEGLVQVERNVMAGLLGFIAICLMAANLVE